MAVFSSLGLEGKYMQTASTANTGEVVLNLSAHCEDWVSSYFCQRLHFLQEEATEGFLYVTRSESHLPTAFLKEQEAPRCTQPQTCGSGTDGTNTGAQAPASWCEGEGPAVGVSQGAPCGCAIPVK